MRKLNIEDAFAFSEILDKMGIDTDLNKIMDEGKKKGADWVGGQIFLLLFKKMHLAKKELIGFISSVSGKSEEDINALDIKGLKDLFIELANNEGLASFFKSALPQEQK